MKFSEQWLREWVDPPVTTDQLVAQLTAAGLEVDAVEPVAREVNGVVVGEIIEVAPHPRADRLVLCSVNAGEGRPVLVVCGAPNARAGLRAPFAKVGARLPDGHKIRRSKIRGVASNGMLCSPRELGLGESDDALLELAGDAPVGVDLAQHLRLDDVSIDIDLTPNRGECLGLAGIAREVGVLNRCPVAGPDIPLVVHTVPDRLPVRLEAPGDCPRYVGRVIRGIRQDAQTPLWLRERLRRSGLRPINAVVDVTNYVMLELGQPLHAFDLQKLDGGIVVRKALPDEELVLLDERKVTLDPDALVIADQKNAVALAGIMGGLETAVTGDTRDMFLESAFFSPRALTGAARRFGLHTDASHRFERGVDPELQRRAAERATALLLDVVGGEAGPVVDEVSAGKMPRRRPIRLRAARIQRLLGMQMPADTVSDLLTRLGMHVEPAGDDWQVTPPSFRFDIAIEADLIEELVRLVGYDRVPLERLSSSFTVLQASESTVSEATLRRVLVERGYHEAITYSFVERELQTLLDPEMAALPLSNPISTGLAVMRTSLWPGLVGALLHNINRQQSRVRLFETGLSFRCRDGQLDQSKRLAGIVTGPRDPEQWGCREQAADFFDMKSDVEALLRLSGPENEFRFAESTHPALHPGQAAVIRRADREIGLLGALHPRIAARLKLPAPAYVFELALDAVTSGRVPSYRALSKFPAVRRDIAIIVGEAVTAGALRECVGQVAPDVLNNLELFDVYRGKGIDSGKKSIALGLTFQATSRTLTDAEIDAFVAEILAVLTRRFGAVLRG